MIICPQCGETWAAPKIQLVPAVAEVFGMSAETLGMVHRDQQARSIQREVDRHFSTHTGTEWANALLAARSARPCQRCDGCGLIANTDDGEAWTFWASLEPGADLAVQLGMVAPIPCPTCFPDRVPAEVAP